MVDSIDFVMVVGIAVRVVVVGVVVVVVVVVVIVVGTWVVVVVVVVFVTFGLIRVRNLSLIPRNAIGDIVDFGAAYGSQFSQFPFSPELIRSSEKKLKLKAFSACELMHMFR